MGSCNSQQILVHHSLDFFSADPLRVFCTLADSSEPEAKAETIL
jgi:hypothetical protein